MVPGLRRGRAVLSERVERSLPFSAEQLFDLAADVERYPEFLRWWIAARIFKREAGAYYTDQILGLGPVRIKFRSKTVLQRPTRIDVTSDDSLFQTFTLSWIFMPEPTGRCRVTLIAELELRSRLLQRIADYVLPNTIADIIADFEDRARRLCEPTQQPPENARPDLNHSPTQRM